MENLLKAFGDIKTFVFDVDGVLTDGSVHITETGELLRRMYIKDGYALQLAVKKGYNILIITGGRSLGVVKRLNGLGITEIHSNISDKLTVFESYLKEKKVKPKTCLYMGDDIPDLPVMKLAGISACPNDAAPDIIQTADYVSEFPGGRGCVREVIEKVMKIQLTWSPH